MRIPDSRSVFQLWSYKGITVNSEIFERILFSRIALRQICDVQNSRPRDDLHILVNDRVISPYRESFIFTKFRENKTLAKISEFTV